MSTNGDRIAAYERFKRKHPIGKPLRVDASSAQSYATIVMILSAAIVVTICAIGIWQHATQEPSWTQQVVEECERQGKTPHVERDAAGKVLGVRCDVARP